MFSMCKSTLNFPAFSKKYNQQIENNNSNIKTNSETNSKNTIKKQDTSNNLNTKLLKPYYSNNFAKYMLANSCVSSEALWLMCPPISRKERRHDSLQ